MQTMFKRFFFVSIVVLLISCKGKKNEEGILIEGTLNGGLRGQMVYLEELTPRQRVKIDSAVVNAGQFSFRLFPSETGFYILSISPTEFVTLLIDTNDKKITFSGEANTDLYGNYTVSGSKGSEIIMQMNRRLFKAYKIIDSLRKVYNEVKPTPNYLTEKPKLDSIYFDVLLNHRKFLEKVIHENLGSLVTIIALYQQIGKNSLFDPEDDIDLFILVDSALQKSFPTSKHAQYLHDRALEFKKKKAEKEIRMAALAIGATPPDINLADPKGKLQSLYSLRGKYVLIDFWASWCKPCKAELPKLIKLYNKYKKKNFEIYAVSLDKSMESWTEAIKKDKMEWINVSDLSYWNSPIARIYDIKSIPYKILLDTSGRIIAKDFGIDFLEEKLKEIFASERKQRME